ncbi:MAG: hypothetical protein IKK14_09250, partial [Oscillospiraceae bacterium]|nr:hypothetical protein [Oscillospiraceae bacterium]
TYDNNGNVIPLSERFKNENRDIRYSAGRDFNELEAESRAKEINDSAKRVLAQMKQRPTAQSSTGQVNYENESTNLENLPQSEKTKRIERRFKRAVEDGVASVFGVSRGNLKGDIRPIIDEIADDVKAGKKITDEQIDKVYRQAFADGIITEDFPQYEETRKRIRETPIFVDEQTRHEFGDDFAFRDFARSNFGSMKISSDARAMHLDEFYMSLADMEPDFFNEFETDPKTQLEEIADFMQQTKRQYYGLSEVYSGESLAQFESWAKGELLKYMQEFGKGVDTVRAYERDRQIKATNKARKMDKTASFDEAKAAFDGNRIFEAKRNMEKIKAKHALNDNDLDTLKRLLAGTMTEADVIFKGAGNVDGIIEVYNAEKAYREARAPFDRYRKAYKTALLRDAVEATEQSDGWNDKSWGIGYSRETAERNVMDITKGGNLGGKEVIAEYIEPIHEHEAMKTRWIKEFNQKVKNLDLGRMNKYERAYTQMIGENAAYISEGKITKHDEAEHEALNEKIADILNRHGS